MGSGLGCEDYGNDGLASVRKGCRDLRVLILSSSFASSFNRGGHLISPTLFQVIYHQSVIHNKFTTHMIIVYVGIPSRDVAHSSREHAKSLSEGFWFFA
jgi:hypothetical protein